MEFKMKKITIDEAQELRKEGYTIVCSFNYKKILLVTKDEDEAHNLKKEYLKKNKVVKILGKLVKFYTSKKELKNDVDESLINLRLGLNCR